MEQAEAKLAVADEVLEEADTGTSSSTAEPNGNTACALLNIPTELRLEIYEHHYSTLPAECDEIDLVNDLANRSALLVLPSKNILMVCKQAYQEADSIYRKAYRHFWSETKFMIKEDRNRGYAVRLSIDQLRDEEIHAITRLNLRRDSMYVPPREEERRWELADGIWRVYYRGSLQDGIVLVAEGRKLAGPDIHRCVNNSGWVQGAKFLLLQKPLAKDDAELAVRRSGRSHLTRYELEVLLQWLAIR